MSAPDQSTRFKRVFRVVVGVLLSMFVGLLVLLLFDLLRPARAPSFGMLLSRAWPELPIVAALSLALLVMSRALRRRPERAIIAGRLRSFGLGVGMIAAVPLALMMIEACCYEPIKFGYLISRVEHATTAEAERAAFELADRWGRVWELNRLSKREYLPERAQHLSGDWILELEWLESWPLGRPYRAYRKVIDEQNMRVFNHEKSANKVTGANAGGPRQLAMRTLWAARVAQFWR